MIHQQFAVFKNLVDAKFRQVLRHYQIGRKSGSHGAPVPEAEIFSRVQSRHSHRGQGVQPQGHRLAEEVVKMPGAGQVFGVAVIGDQHGAAQAGGGHGREEIGQVFGQAAFPEHQVKP